MMVGYGTFNSQKRPPNPTKFKAEYYPELAAKSPSKYIAGGTVKRIPYMQYLIF